MKVTDSKVLELHPITDLSSDTDTDLSSNSGLNHLLASHLTLSRGTLSRSLPFRPSRVLHHKYQLLTFAVLR